MNLSKYINIDNIKIFDELKNKKELLNEIAKLISHNSEADNITQKEIYKKLLAREKISSTGFNKGIAIPHCRIDNIKKFYVGIIIVKHGIDFDSLDKEKSKIFMFIIGPSEENNKHIHLLSSISHLLHEPDITEKFINSKNEKEVLEELLNFTGKDVEYNNEAEFCNLNIIVEKEELFEQILQIIFGFEKCYVNVIESNPAKTYLYKLPLFASFWQNEDNSYSKLILAVVPKTMVNEIIRQIDLEIDGINKIKGILITVQNLNLCLGSLET